MTAGTLFTPSATMCIFLTISSRLQTFAELFADEAIAAVDARARRDEVAHSGKSRERFGSTAERGAEAGDLGETARDDRRARVVAGAEPVAHAGGDRHDVLQHAAEFAADDVGIRVDAEQPGAEQFLQASHDRVVVHREHARGRVARHDFAREVRSGQHAGRVTRQDVGDDLRHPRLRAGFEAFRQADHRHPRPDVLADVGQRRAEHLRRHAHHDHVGVAHRLGEVGGGATAAPTTAHRQDTGGSCACSLISATVAGSRAHSTVGVLRDTIDAIVVPHEPPPITATRNCIAPPPAVAY